MKKNPFQTKIGVLATTAGILLFGMFFAVAFKVFAFNGPTTAPPNGYGALGSDASNNISIGTSTTAPTTKLFVVGAGSDSNSFAEKEVANNQTPLFILRDDGSVAVATSSFVPGATNIGNNLNVANNLTVGGLLSANNLGSSTINAQNVSAGAFGSGTGGGSFSFPSGLSVGLTGGTYAPIFSVSASNIQYGNWSGGGISLVAQNASLDPNVVHGLPGGSIGLFPGTSSGPMDNKHTQGAVMFGAQAYTDGSGYCPTGSVLGPSLCGGDDWFFNEASDTAGEDNLIFSTDLKPGGSMFPGLMAPYGPSIGFENGNNDVTSVNATAGGGWILRNNSNFYFISKFGNPVGTTTTIAGTGNIILMPDANVGIGSSSFTPNAKLTIANNLYTAPLGSSYGQYQIMLYDGSSASTSYGMGVENYNIGFNSNGGYKFYQSASSTPLMVIGGQGSTNVGIGTTTPAYPLTVNGNIYATGNITCGGTCGSSSSAPAAPVIVVQPNSQIVNAGDSATFSVVATGVPAPTYQWQYFSGSWKSFAAGTGTTSSVMATFSTTAAYNGLPFQVVVTNSQGTVTSNPVTLTINTTVYSVGTSTGSLVGIGTTTPQAPLHVNSGDNTTTPFVMLLGTATSSWYVDSALNTVTVTNPGASPTLGSLDYTTLNPSAAMTNYYQHADLLEIPAASTNNFASLSTGLDGLYDYGSGNVGSLIGVIALADFASTGAMSGGLYGGNFLAQIVNAGSNQTSLVPNMYGVVANVANGSTNGTVTNRYGFYGTATNSGTVTKDYGLYLTGFGNGTHTNTPFDIYAADANTSNYFAGNVGIGTTNPSTALTVSGTITATTKNFEIKYPGDGMPGYDLVHSTLEGPEVGVYYRGTASLVNGQATVALPPYFGALTRAGSETVYLTAKGKVPFSLSYDSFDHDAGTFIVYGSTQSGSFDWQVEATRADVAPLQVVKPTPGK